jgi:hypothetical protein
MGMLRMDDADAPLARQRNRHARFGHGVHRRTHDRDAQPNVPHQRCADIDLVGQHLGVVGQQQHIVETQRFGQHLHPERLLWRSIVPD